MESALRGPVPSDLKVIETVGLSPDGDVARLEAHLARAEITCFTFGFAFNRGQAVDALSAIKSDVDLRVRMTWGADGFDITHMAKGVVPDVWRLAIHEERLHSNDAWLQVKTTQRKLYDTSRANLADGIDEWLFLNEQDHVCEGTITNVFVRFERALLTPPLTNGLLPGVLRQSLLDEGVVKEGIVTTDMLHSADEIFVGNSLRGLIKAKLV
ncbi:MAG: aminotransferase class IV [Pseudomonadota bacterium]